MSFSGNFPVKLDDKSRIAIPTKCRPQFESGPAYLTLTKDRCISVFTKQSFEERRQKLFDALDGSDQAEWRFRNFNESAHEVVPDAQGRVTIPQTYLARANIERDRETFIIGNFDRLEIWDVATHRAANPFADEVA